MIYLIDGVKYKELRIVRPNAQFHNILQGVTMDDQWVQIKTIDYPFSEIREIEEYLKQNKNIVVIDDQRRNTQFLGFALALFNDLNWDDINIDMEKSGWEDQWRLKIAQRAYDFALHVVDAVMLDATSIWNSPRENIEAIPDVPVLPEEQ